MKKLSEQMESCLDFIDRHATNEAPWVEIPSWRWSISTVQALQRRGLIKFLYRKEKLNPNKFPKLNKVQAIENIGAVWWDPWARCKEES